VTDHVAAVGPLDERGPHGLIEFEAKNGDAPYAVARRTCDGEPALVAHVQ
jgi:hypothetical protein